MQNRSATILLSHWGVVSWVTVSELIELHAKSAPKSQGKKVTLLKNCNALSLENSQKSGN